VKLITTQHGYKRFDPIPEVDYSTYYTTEKPSCIDNQEKDLRWWNIVHDDRLAILENSYREDGVLLDVGCGAGFFLYRAREFGWRTEGIDPNKTAIQYATEKLHLLTVSTKNIQELPPNHYSAIHCSEVLEHVPNPEELLKECYRVMRKNGIICICVPNDFNPLQALLEKQYGQYWVSYPYHINYFNFQSLAILMSAVGFVPVYATSMFPLELFALAGVPYIGNEKIGRMVHSARMHLDTHLEPEFRMGMYENFANYGIGREAIIYGTKL
jgi:2-polyprenyl-3-methyl-5-hydroxy-6-metoxy-1,4-benzoquinol methylase